MVLPPNSSSSNISRLFRKNREIRHCSSPLDSRLSIICKPSIKKPGDKPAITGQCFLPFPQPCAAIDPRPVTLLAAIGSEPMEEDAELGLSYGRGHCSSLRGRGEDGRAPLRVADHQVRISAYAEVDGKVLCTQQRGRGCFNHVFFYLEKVKCFKFSSDPFLWFPRDPGTPRVPRWASNRPPESEKVRCLPSSRTFF